MSETWKSSVLTPPMKFWTEVISDTCSMAAKIFDEIDHSSHSSLFFQTFAKSHLLRRWSIMSNKKDGNRWTTKRLRVWSCQTFHYLRYLVLHALQVLHSANIDVFEWCLGICHTLIIDAIEQLLWEPWQDAVDGYVARFEDDSLTERTTTDEYYNVATDFYLYGWGNSFHFATRFAGESLEDSIVRPPEATWSSLRPLPRPPLKFSDTVESKHSWQIRSAFFPTVILEGSL